MKINDQPAQLTAPGEVRLVRLLPGPIERVWEFLTDPEKRSRWFAGGPMNLEVGGKLTLHFHHINLAPDETPPQDYEKVHHHGVQMEGTILRCDPPHTLSYTFGENSDVTFELTTQGDQVQLVLTHRSRGADTADLHEFSSGWHSHTNLLVALLEGATIPPFWAPHAQLLEYYKNMISGK